MKWMIHGLFGGMALVAAGMANASTSTLPGQGGAVALTFSADWVGVLDTIRATVTPYGAGGTYAAKDTDGFFTQVSAAAPITSLTVDTGSLQTLGLSTSGGFTLSTPVLKSVSSGGSLTVTDLSVDFTNKTIYGTLIGGNGVGTLTHLDLWRFSSVTGDLKLSPSPTLCDEWWSPTTGWGCSNPYAGSPRFTVSGLMITSDGLAKFNQSLGMLTLGRAGWNGIDDYGTLVSGVVPEASTSLMMGLGLLGLALKRRRRVK